MLVDEAADMAFVVLTDCLQFLDTVLPLLVFQLEGLF